METGYELEIDNKYIMSRKDLCTIGFIDKMIEAGVRVLKIEGRARSAEYVKEVSSCYADAVCSIEDGTFSREKTDMWRERLSTVFNRGFWDGYYLGQTMGEWNSNYGSSATKRKIYIGKVTNYFKKLNVAEIKLENGDLKTGDTILITGPTTGVVQYEIEEVRVELNATDSALKGELCSIKAPDILRRSDKVYKWVDYGDLIPLPPSP
jgi:putative protease